MLCTLPFKIKVIITKDTVVVTEDKNAEHERHEGV